MYFILSVVLIESGHGLFGFFWLKTCHAVKLLAKPVILSEDLTGEASTPGSLRWLLAGLEGFSSKLTYVSLSTELLHGMAPGFPRGSSPRESKSRHPRRKPHPFHNWISYITSHYFCYILFIRSESLSPTYSQGKEITQGCAHQEMEIIEDRFRGCLPCLTSQGEVW